jgi:hypothetical protein
LKTKREREREEVSGDGKLKHIVGLFRFNKKINYETAIELHN